VKILVITQYFWPENFRVNDLCLELLNRGHNVVVLTGKPNYPKGYYYKGYGIFTKKIEYWNGIKIVRTNLIPRGNGRSWELILNYFSFTLFSIFKLLTIREKFDKIISYQLSPGFIGFPAVLAKKYYKADLLFYIQDLWPESILDAGQVKNKFILNILDKMMNYFYQESNYIIIQSKGFHNFLLKKNVPSNKIFYIPNTAEDFYKPENKNGKYDYMFKPGINLLFAGNIGEAQDFNTLINAAKILYEKNFNINWVIFGDGRLKQKSFDLVKSFGLEGNFNFYGSFPSIEMPYLFSYADALIISLKKSEIFAITIPSKLQSYFACEKVIIGSVEGVSEDIIKQANAGYTSKPGLPENLADNIIKFCKLSSIERGELASNARKYYLKEFDRKVVYDKLENLLKLHTLLYLILN
jgi:glycosyltransferase involved in cell wall biosynthesis